MDGDTHHDLGHLGVRLDERAGKHLRARQSHPTTMRGFLSETRV